MSIEQPVSVWKGSTQTMRQIAQQIEERWGKEAVNEYDPGVNCFTFRGWQERGYHVKKGEKALKTFTFIPESNEVDENGKSLGRSYPKSVCLFFIRQVEPVKKTQEVTA